MYIMKKTMLILSAIAILLSMSACGDSDTEARIDLLEQRVSALEEGQPAAAQSTQAPRTTDSTSGNQTSNTNNSELDVLSFENILFDTNYSDDTVKASFNVTNNGTEPIEYVSLDFAYYDADGNCSDTDGRFHDVVIEPGKFVTVDSYAGDETTKAYLASAKVTSYYYILVNPNSNGNNRIEVNCETGKVKESFTED